MAKGFTFEVFGGVEAKSDLVPVAAGLMAHLGDTKTEAGNAARVGLHVEEALGARTWKSNIDHRSQSNTPISNAKYHFITVSSAHMDLAPPLHYPAQPFAPRTFSQSGHVGGDQAAILSETL